MDDFLCRRHFVISYLFFWNHGLNNRCLITTVDSYFCFQHFIWCIFCHNLYFQNGCFLRILCTACAVSARAVIFILPSPTPVITPSSTVATVLSELLHSTGVPSGVTIATTVTVSPTQIFPLSLSSRIVVFSGSSVFVTWTAAVASFPLTVFAVIVTAPSLIPFIIYK